MGKGAKEAVAGGRAEHGDGGALVLARETERDGLVGRGLANWAGPVRSVQRGIKKTFSRQAKILKTK